MLLVYAIPSFMALWLKLILVIWISRKGFQSANLWVLYFLLGLLGINFWEFVSFFYVSRPESAFFVLSAYYIFAVFAMFSLLLLTLSSVGKLTTLIKVIVGSFFLVSIVPLLIPNAALLGVKSIGYSITRIAGPYYYLVQLGILLPLSLSVVILGYFSVWGSDKVVRKAQVLLLACLPIFVAIGAVMGLMHLGYQLNASVVLSVAVILTMVILVRAERRQGDFQFIERASAYKLTSLLPRSRDHRFVKRMMSLLANPEIGLAKGRELIEQEMIREALSLADGNKTRAADMLGVSRQTLIRRLAGYAVIANAAKQSSTS